MIEFNKIFIDTSIFIYYLEDNERYCDKIINLIEFCVLNNISFVTSTIAYMEFCVKPYEMKKEEVIKKFQELLIDFDIKVYGINIQVADIAAKLRSKYKGIKAMDALQISTAIYSSSNKFITNDRKLKSIDEIDVMLIDDMYKVIHLDEYNSK